MSADQPDEPALARHALALDDSMTVLVALEGYIDVFAVAASSTGAPGALHHLYRASAGVPVVGGVAAPPTVERFVAVPGPSASIETTTRKDWLAYYADSPVEPVAELLTQAIWEWSTALSQEHSPENPERLVPEETLSAVAGKQLACDYGIVAVEISSGALNLCGVESARLGPGDLAFLTRHAHLAVEEDAEVAVYSTEALDTIKSVFKAFRTFQQCYTLVACQFADSVERSSTEQMRQRVQGIRESLDNGLLSMRRLLEPGAEQVGESVTGQAAVLVATRRIAALQGFSLTEVEAPPADGALHAQSLAEASGARVRQVALSGAWWLQDNGPLLAFSAADDTPLVLEPKRGRKYFAYDPSSGTRSPVNEAFASGLKPFALFFYRPFPHKPIRIWDLVSFGFAGQRRDLWLILALAAAIALITMVVPLATAEIIDRVIPSAQTSVLVQIGVVLMIAALVQSLIELTRGLFLLRVQNRMEHNIQAAIWDRVLGMPIGFFRDYAVGDLTMRVNAINMVYRSFTVHTAGVILSGTFSLLSFALLFKFSAALALLAVGIVVGAIAMVVVFFYVTMHELHHVIASNRRIMALILQLVQGVAKLRTTASETRAFGLWASEFTIYRSIRFKIGKLSAQQKLFFSGYENLAIVLIFVTMGALMTRPGGANMSTGDFVGFFAAFATILLGVIGVCEALIGMYLVIPMYKMAAPLLTTLPETNAGKVHPGSITGSIEVSQVSFAYPDGETVLDDVSFSVPAGSFTAIVGPSGSGKSTLLRLLLGFDQPEVGAVLFDDKNLTDLDLRALRKQFGVVLQGSPLMAGDIFSNIVGVSGGTLDDAWAAAKLAGLDDDIHALPMGMHSAIGEGTSTLSGGQRQRILLARALVGNPRVLFLDEATSALDNQSQALVSNSLLRLKSTRLIIAHRLSTVAQADQIVVLDQGKVVQIGTYEELIEQHDGLFAGLARRQSLESETTEE